LIQFSYEKTGNFNNKNFGLEYGINLGYIIMISMHFSMGTPRNSDPGTYSNGRVRFVVGGEATHHH
jgi:hypothetical protein